MGLLESDSEDEAPHPEGTPHQPKNNLSRLSQLSKLNLLGLIDLALVACNLKLFKGVDLAIKQCEQSIIMLKALNGDQSNDVGIASQNLLEELLDNLLIFKEKELDVIDEEEGPETISSSPPIKPMNLTSSSQKPDPQQMQYLQ